MSKRSYYCLIAGLPDLFFNENKTGFSSMDFRNELKHQLSITDFNLAKLLYLPYDNTNLLNLLFHKNTPFILAGNYKKEILENGISSSLHIPDYMNRFVLWAKKTESNTLNLQARNKLLSLFYEHVLTCENIFLKEWFTFELNIKNILTSINCRQFNYTTEGHIIQVEQNNTVFSLLSKKHLKSNLFEEEIPFADQIFRIAESNSNLKEKENATDKIFWAYLDDQTFFHYFTIEKILSYIIKIGIIERWMKLNAETGKVLLNQLIKELKDSYKFTEEFSTVKYN